VRSKEDFKALLDASHQWPQDYIFKFVIPAASLDPYRREFPEHKPSFRSSAGGKYLALTVIFHATSADEILAIYSRAEKVPGLLAL
jgi:hypothetical protein